jgi:glycosyltransferase involved in cell wall biosynthesis
VTPVARLSVIVLTLNEERNIGRCLGSVRWADEIVVIDSYSTDRTTGIAREHGALILEHEYDSDLRQRSRGFERATGEWLLVLDADEEVPGPLAAEIREAVGRGDDTEGYFLARLVSFEGRWIRHGGWYPGHAMRLFRKESVVVEDAAVHGGYTVKGPKGYLSNPLHHYSYDSISHYLRKMNDYTSLQVTNLLRSRPGYVPGFGKILFSPLSHFIRNYVTRKGYRDGMQGFLLAALDSVYALALYAKLWEYRTVTGVRTPAPLDMDAIRAMKRRYPA